MNNINNINNNNNININNINNIKSNNDFDKNIVFSFDADEQSFDAISSSQDKEQKLRL